MTDAPPAVEIEPVWYVEATYAPDGAETRAPFRAQHLARLAGLIAEGRMVMVGAFTDVSASIALVRAPDEQAALDLVRDDVYLRNGVWVEVRARPFGVVKVRAAEPAAG